ncbi:hypothetical protein [Streptomyces sp. NPDC096033]|uniref:hypothetical protein n=1 Tax=Streptomyces sp. NPDC096033 TaxID=3366071 RepID=UPI00382FAF39
MDIVLGDCGYDQDKYRCLVRARGVKPLIGRRSTESMAPGWELDTGSWKARSRISTGFAACGAVGRYAMTSTDPSASSDAHWSADEA